MKTKSNALSLVTTQLTSQGAKVKTTSEKSSLTMPEMLDLVHDAGLQVLAYKGADDTKVQALEIINTKGLTMHNGGTRLADGRSNDPQTKALKSAFIDSMGDLKPAYKQNVYELFAKLVNSGKEIKDLNKSRNSKKNGEGKAEVDFDVVIAKVYNHSDFAELSKNTQNELKEVLAKAGYEFPDA
jgi:hypothetical protein